MARVIKRRQHWKDEVTDEAKPTKLKRTIGNWMHYRTPKAADIDDIQDWEETDATPEAAPGKPNHWTGNFDFQYQVLKAPLQAFVGDSTDPLNTALIGIRNAEKPRQWMNLKALGVNNGATMQVFPAQKAVRWVDLWDNTDLSFQLFPHKFDKQIKLKAPGHPASFRFAIRLPNNFTHEIINNKRLLIKNGQGRVVFKSPPVWGRDDDGNAIDVGIVSAADITVGQKTFPTFRVIPSAVDLTTATYPVIVDPSVTISGTADIEDAILIVDTAAPDHTNNGNNTTFGILVGNNNDRYYYRGIERVATSALPEGTVDSFKHHVYVRGSAGVGGAGSATVYRIAEANEDWVEGDANDGDPSGVCDWFHRTHGLVEWAGSQGLTTATTDYDTADSATVTLGATVGWKEHTLTASWVEDWKDGTWDNAGMLIVGQHDTFPTTTQATAYSYYDSTERPNASYYVVEYTEGGPPDTDCLDPNTEIIDANLDRKV